MDREEKRFLILLLAGVTIALALLVRPFFGAVFWAVVVAIMFENVYTWLLSRSGGRRAVASGGTIALITALIVLPALGIAFAIFEQIATLYLDVQQTGGVDLNEIFLRVQGSLPQWAIDLLRRNGLGDIDAIRERLVSWLAGGFQTIAARVILLSQGAFGFFVGLGVTLYLAFFLLMDGRRIIGSIQRATPLRASLSQELCTRIASVIRATVKGSFVIAVLQGLLGGLIFSILGIGGALLWSIAMAFLSLIPAIGAGFVWLPVAIYLLITGAFWNGIILILFGAFVISMVDNVVRPVLVGRDTQMPDWVIFISTIGGISLFGLNGVVIGPVIAALFIAIWGIYTEQREEQSGHTAEAHAPEAGVP